MTVWPFGSGPVDWSATWAMLAAALAGIAVWQAWRARREANAPAFEYVRCDPPEVSPDGVLSVPIVLVNTGRTARDLTARGYKPHIGSRVLDVALNGYAHSGPPVLPGQRLVVRARFADPDDPPQGEIAFGCTTPIGRQLTYRVPLTCRRADDGSIDCRGGALRVSWVRWPIRRAPG